MIISTIIPRSLLNYCHFVKLWIYLLTIFILMDRNYSIKWLGISRYTRSENLELERFSSVECRFNSLNHGLEKRQTKFCLHHHHSYAMHGILRASKAAVFYCMKTFQDRRWNCSSAERLPYIGKDLESGTQEQAIVHAFSSASLMYEIARRCAQNKMSHCTCGNSPQNTYPEMTQEKQLFAGCPDNTDIGMDYVRKFTGYHKLGRKKFKSKNSNNSGSRYLNKKREESLKRRQLKIKRINGHNYEAGVMIQLANQRTHCKCHGVSGGCSQRICYRQLRRLDDDFLLTILRKQYLSAKYVDITPEGKVVAADPFGDADNSQKPISDKDLVFIEHSPDFCEYDISTGSLGTHGRRCKIDNVTATATDHCTNMCCGRGFRMVMEERKTKCDCRIDDKFKIQCNECSSNVKTYYCL